MATLPKAKSEAKIVKSIKGKESNAFNIIKERQTEELVLAFCGPLGSGVSSVAKQFGKILKSYNYKHQYIKISNYISENISLFTSFKPLKSTTDAAKKISDYQDAGNELRKQLGFNILAQFAIRDIVINRFASANINIDELKDDLMPESRRHVTIIDSLKHPDEVKLLKAVYGNMFFMFAVLCPEQVRKNRLQISKNITNGKESELMERDKSETDGFGQKLLDTLQYADFFIRNDDISINSLEGEIKRYINLILGDAFISPTISEYGMYCAQSAALRSSCLSRQVGAAIVSSSGELISTGCNEVPKYGGEYYSDCDGSKDGRCMNMFGNECANKKYKDLILKDIENELIISINDKELRKNILENISKKDRIKNLLEFSRSVHAEMDAIVNVARTGNGSLKGATLYCTTFPCHNCARHIVASGINKVYYIEPYEKSLARDLHYDSIDFDSKESEVPRNKVIFTPFAGVAPRQYMNLFVSGERKEKGKRKDQDFTISKPKVVQYLDNYLQYELKVIDSLKNL